MMFVVVAAAPLAQPSGTGERGSIPPGSSRDGSRPSEGAIEGGSIPPAEASGSPPKPPNRSSQHESNRCKELKGALRDDCLRDASKSPHVPERPAQKAH
jgi:hypothetical protein